MVAQTRPLDRPAILAPVEPAPRPAAIEFDGCDTVPKLFWSKVTQRGDRVAMREKDFGIWHSITWREYGERAKFAGLGLVALGLGRGDVISIAADNIPE
jgi:long-chain acyl-CoA synthetase